MRRLFLHIGTHKTGTTTVQRFFSMNRDALRRIGIWYPSPAVAGLPDHYAHHRISHGIAGRDADVSFEDARNFFDTIRAQATQDEAIFISAEPLYRHVMDGEDPYASYASRVREAIGEFSITLMFMFRRQDLFAESLYAEHVMSSGYTGGIEDFIDERAELLDYEKRLSVWSNAFPGSEIVIDAFEPAFFVRPIEQMFVEWLGGAWDETLVRGARRNVSLPRTLVEFKRQMNATDQGATVNAQYRHWLEKLAQTPAAKGFPDLGRYYLGTAQRIGILDEHAEGNRIVAERYLARPHLFQESVFDDLRRYQDRPPLLASDFRKISKVIFRMLSTQ